MSNIGRITMWTGQMPIVMEEIQRSGRYVVKKEYMKQKYDQSAWIFQEAYQYLALKVQEWVKKPEGAESPIWVYRRQEQIFGGNEVCYLKLSIPANQVILFDSRKWNRILNLSYIGSDANDEESFEQKLKKHGITDSLKIFSTAYYPIEKREVKRSWERLFEKEQIDDIYLQGMI